jgi:hypothetical protein
MIGIYRPQMRRAGLISALLLYFQPGEAIVIAVQTALNLFPLSAREYFSHDPRLQLHSTLPAIQEERWLMSALAFRRSAWQ